MFRKLLAAIIVLVAVSAFATPARAQDNQTIQFNVGLFTIRGAGNNLPVEGVTRAPGDVLVAELNGGTTDALDFRMKDFNKATFGADWLFGFGELFEAGVGVGYYRATVPSVSLNFVNPDGTEITQQLQLRIIPITGTIRFLPIGRNNFIEPYIGGGIGIFPFRYMEVGNFVLPDTTIVNNQNSPYLATGVGVGPVIVGGARFPIGNISIGGEVRWQRATGDLPTTGNNPFIAPKIDLGGTTYHFTFGLRF